MPSDPREHLPLPPHDFHILLALLEAPQHAYGLSRSVDEDDGRLTLEIGSLYRILSRLSAAGLIESAAAPAGEAGGHEARRKYYRITPLGRRVAAAEAQRLDAVLRLARRHKLLQPRGSS
jgi:DNA-binding PadR family transcriptional regulator